MLKYQLQANNFGQAITQSKKLVTENEFISVDISGLNLMDALNTAILCSTHHYTKFPKGKVQWVVSSLEVERLAKPFSLGNAVFST